MSRHLKGIFAGVIWVLLVTSAFAAGGGDPIFLMQGHDGYISSVAVSPKGDLAASGSHDGTVRLWNMKDGKCTKILKGHMDKVYSVAFSPDGKQLASGSADMTIRIWDLGKSREGETG